VSYRLKVEFADEILEILNARRGGAAPTDTNADPQTNEPFLKDSDVKARQTELFSSFKGNIPEQQFRRDTSKTEETKEKPDSKRFI
jgi:hypothetical protein